MQQTTKTNHYIEDEIYLKDVINLLIASKKLIIIIALLSSILAFYYSSTKPPTFTSSALIEIGTYNLVNFDESEGQIKPRVKRILIESAKSIVKELNIAFVHKNQSKIFNGKLTTSIIEDRLIRLSATSLSSEIGIKSLNEMTSYILKRHENIVTDNTQRNLNLINTKIELLNSDIELKNKHLLEAMDLNDQFYKEEQVLLNKELADTKKRIKEINQKLPIIDKKISALMLIISEDTANLRLLESDPQLLKEMAAGPQTLHQVIYLYKNSILDFEFDKVSLESELLILNDSLSRIKMALENNSRDSIDLSDDSILSRWRTQSLVDFSTQVSTQIFRLSHEKSVHENNLQSLMAQTTSNSILIGEIKSSQTNPKIIKFVFQGFMFGMILSIGLALIIGKMKAYKEENAITL